MRLKPLHGRISKDFSWELSGFRMLRSFSDGISFFEIENSLELWKGDHNPQFRFMVTVLNLKIIEFSVYNIHHVPEEEEYEHADSDQGGRSDPYP